MHKKSTLKKTSVFSPTSIPPALKAQKKSYFEEQLLVIFGNLTDWTILYFWGRQMFQATDSDWPSSECHLASAAWWTSKLGVVKGTERIWIKWKVMLVDPAIKDGVWFLAFKNT